MTDKASIMERAGMPFDERCQRAQGHLELFLNEIRHLADAELQTRQADAEWNESFLASLKNPEARELLAGDYAEFDRKSKDSEARFRAEMWEVALSSCRDMYGTDATDFALEAVKRKSPHN